MPRFSQFVKGWIARTLPELMPQGSLRRCEDLNYGIEGALRSSREMVEVVDPTGISHATHQLLGFFQVASGDTTLTYIVRNNELLRDKNNAGFASIKTLESKTFNYSTYFTEDDSEPGILTVSATGVTVIAVVPTALNYPDRLYRPTTIPSDFEYTFDFRCKKILFDSTGTTSRAAATLFGVSDAFALSLGAQAATCLSVIHLSGSTVGGQHAIRLQQNRGDSGAAVVRNDHTGLTRMTDYYATVKKDSTVGAYGSFSCSLYSDSARTTQIGTTTSITLEEGPQNFNYLFGFSGPWSYNEVGNFGSTGTSWTGRVRNLAQPLGSAGEVTRVNHVVMTPSVSTQKIVYVATTAGLMRDGGQSKYTSGSTWVAVGCPTPSGMDATGCSKAKRTALTGAYKVAYTYYDSEVGAESYPSGTSTITLAATNTQVTWPVTSVAAGHADQVKIYRSIADGGTLFLNGTVDLATGTTYLSCGDSLLGASIGDIGQPPTNATLCEAWKGRLWVSGVSYFDSTATANRIYYSRNLLPETMPPDYYLAIPKTDAEVNGLAIFEGRLYVFTETSLYEIEGSTSDSFKLSDALSPVGTASTRSIAVGREGIFFVARDGVYMFKYRSTEVSNLVKWLFDESDDVWSTRLTDSSIASSKGVYWDGEYYVTIGSKTYIYDAEAKRWRSRSKGFSCSWVDQLTQTFYAGVSIPSKSYQAIYSLSNDGTTGVSRAYVPDFITKPEFLSPPSKENPVPGMGRVSKFKTHCKGFWTFYFYCDETLSYTATGTTYTGASRNQVYNLDSDIKGTTLHVRGVASGSGVTPGSTRFYSMEVW